MKGKTPPTRSTPPEPKNKNTAGKSTAAELTKLFMQTPEMQECTVTAGTIRNKVDPGDTVSIEIKLPRALVQLAEFIERKRAEEAGGKARSTTKLLSMILENDLHDELHWLTVEPAHFAYYRSLWNRFCDAQGAPEHKIADPETSPGKGMEEGPF